MHWCRQGRFTSRTVCGSILGIKEVHCKEPGLQGVTREAGLEAVRAVTRGGTVKAGSVAQDSDWSTVGSTDRHQRGGKPQGW